MAKPQQQNKINANREKLAKMAAKNNGVPKSSESLFWARHVALALLIIVIGGIVIFLQQRNESAPKPEGEVKSRSLSDNMSKFYSEYRLSSRAPREDALDDFVLEVKESDIDLNERLQKMESIQKPISGRWVGEYKHRTFKAGTTLRSAITDYAQAEGMQVIWELNQDFIVKHQFQMENSILGSLKTISSAIDSNFSGKVRAFVCPKQRSLVITDKKSDYLNKECVEARM